MTAFFCKKNTDKSKKIYRYFSNVVVPTGIEPKEINYSERSLREMLPQEFIDFATHEFKPYTVEKIESEFDKEEMYCRFCNENLDYKNDAKFKRTRFTKWLKTFCDYKMIPYCAFRGTKDYFYIYPSRATLARSRGELF